MYFDSQGRIVKMTWEDKTNVMITGTALNEMIDPMLD